MRGRTPEAMPALLPLLLAFLTLGVSEEGWRVEQEALYALPLLLALPHLLGWRARKLLISGRFRRARLLLRLLTHAPVLGHAAAMLLLGYGPALERWMGRSLDMTWWPDLWVVVAIAPWLILELLAIDARARLQYRDPDYIRRTRRWQLRSLSGLLAPLLLFLLISAAVGTSEGARVRIETVGLFASLYSTALILLFVALLPWVLTKAWDTRPLPAGPLREIFERVAQHADFRAREIYAWNTEGSMANAAIVGIGSRLRVVLFSDALLSQLNGRELAAVYAHEIAHAKRGHVLLFGLWAVGAFLAGDLAARHWFAEDPLLQTVCVLGALLLWFLFFGWLSRRCELEADLFALRLFGSHEPIASALERVGGRLRDVAGWRHFSIAQRVQFLERAAQDPELGRRLERGLSVWFALGLVLALSMGGLHGWHELQRLPGEQLEADLKLGLYGQAVERVDAGTPVDARQAALVEIARTLPADRLAAAEFEELALAAWVRGAERERVEGLLVLGAYRGDWMLVELAAALSQPEKSLPERFEARWGPLRRLSRDQ